MVALTGSHAMIRHEPRQARKGATVVTDSCAEVMLVRAISIFTLTFFLLQVIMPALIALLVGQKFR